MADRTAAPIRPLARVVCLSLVSLMAVSCASGGRDLNATGKSADYRGAVSAYPNSAIDTSGLDPVAAAAYWGAEYNRNQNAAQVAVNYSAALRKIGSTAQAVNVMNTAAVRHPDNPEVNLETGRALIEGGRAFEAVRYLERASDDNPTDWKTLSAYGVALDQIGEHKSARVKYDLALTLSPGSISVLNNKGMSYALDGDLDMALRILRTAASSRGADSRVRQNLALVLALRGDMNEAERIARSDLPPQVADRNIDYFRSLLAQPAYWQDVAADNLVTPTFEAARTPAPKAEDKPVALAAPAPQTAPAGAASEPVDGTGPAQLGVPTAPTNASTGNVSTGNVSTGVEIKN